MENTTLKSPTQRTDLYNQVTDIIIQQLEKGVVPWQKPWSGTDQPALKLPINFTTGNRYRGINIVLLWASSLQNQFLTDEWASYKQWQSKEETVRKGEKGSLVVYYDTIEREKDGELKKIPFLKSYKVFNRSQLKSYEKPVTSDEPRKENNFEKLSEVEAFIANTKAEIQWHEEGAYYVPSKDIIKMPAPEKFIEDESFVATEEYYAVLMHELTHWSGHEKRLNRTYGKKFGDENYATEELLAEFGAAFLCAGFGIPTIEKGNHAGYIDHWLKVLKENQRCLFTASSEASKAVDYLNGLQSPLSKNQPTE